MTENDIKVIYNGEEILITEEQFNKLGIKPLLFPSMKLHDHYFFNDGYQRPTAAQWDNDPIDVHRRQLGNCFLSEEDARQVALHETLNRLLWHYAQAHGGISCWDSGCSIHRFYIYYDYDCLDYAVDYQCVERTFGTIYFKDSQTAHNAIENVIKPFVIDNPDFVW